MHPLHPFFPIIIFLIAFVTAYLVRKRYNITYATGRYECIDGMRGFLALSVFVCHSSVWHRYLQTGLWESPKSTVFTHYGQTSVVLFFMITSFLFVSKLLHAREKGFDFRDFLVSRIYRIAPMYYVSILLLVVCVLFASGWRLHTGIGTFSKSILNWSFFTINAAPGINNLAFTNRINAGVVWSLAYEWLFYMSLPLISLLILKFKPKTSYLILSTLFIIVFALVHPINLYHIYPFIGGSAAAILLHHAPPTKKINNKVASVLILFCLLCIVQFRTVNNIACLFFIAVLFTLIAFGATLFGLLRNPTLKFLGDICYSTYLLHGILLFMSFYFVIGFSNSRALSPLQYCLVIFCITPLVVIASFIGFRYVEKPFMEKAKRLRKRLNKRLPAVPPLEVVTV